MSHASAALAIYLLGPPRIERHGQPVEVDTRKAIALLAYLALHPERLSRDQIAALLWPEYDQERAYANLRRTLWALNKAIGEGWLLADHLTLHLQPQTGIRVDVLEFQHYLAQCRDHGHRNDDVCAACLEPLGRAVNLVRGDFLEGFSLRDSAPFDDWCFFAAESLRKQFATALEKLVQGYSRQQEAETAITYARRWLALDPLHEPAHRWLMQLYPAAGQVAAALRQYQECVRILKTELDVPPAAETRALYEQIRTGALADKGHIQAGQPRTNAAAHRAAAPPRHNLPNQLTSFIGRAREISEVKALLARIPSAQRAGAYDQGVRLLTLTGAGGSGKTRLALQVASEMLPAYRDGIWFVDLSSLTDPAFVPQAVALALGFREPAGQPLLDSLSLFLSTKQLLLLLDNCEHLLAACAQLAVTLLRVAADVQILATSREVLAVAGEVTWSVAGLTQPADLPHLALGRLAQVDAIGLFVARAAAVTPFHLTEQNGATVAQICRRLDGMPLAIELAAARVKVLGVAQIAERLDQQLALLTTNNRNVPARQQTLRATLDWSYQLLSETEQALLRRLALFAGGFTLEAAAALAKADPFAMPATAPRFADEVLALLTQLVDKSLIYIDQQPGRTVRYCYLETIRQYAQEQLARLGEAADLRARHAAYFLTLAETAEATARGSQQEIWFERLALEHDNLRTALAWSQANPERGEVELRLAGALWWFWSNHNYLAEGREWLEKALAHNPMRKQTPAWAKALCGLGSLAGTMGDYKVSIARLEESVACWRAVGDRQGLAYALIRLADDVADTGDFAQVARLAEESLTLCRQIGDQWGAGWSLKHLGSVYLDQGDYAGAYEQYEQALTFFRTCGDSRGIGLALNALGSVAYKQEDYSTTCLFYEQALTLFRQQGDRQLCAMQLNFLAAVVKGQGDYARAAVLYTDSLAIAHEIQFKPIMPLCLAGLAAIACASGHPVTAAHLFGAGEALTDALGVSLAHYLEPDHARQLSAVRTALGSEAFSAAWRVGRVMALEEVIAEALTIPLFVQP